MMIGLNTAGQTGTVRTEKERISILDGLTPRAAVLFTSRFRTRIETQTELAHKRTIRRNSVWFVSVCGIGSTTAGKLEDSSREVDADLLPFRPTVPSLPRLLLLVPPMFHPFLSLLFFPSLLEFGNEVWGNENDSKSQKLERSSGPNALHHQSSSSSSSSFIRIKIKTCFKTHRLPLGCDDLRS